MNAVNYLEDLAAKLKAIDAKIELARRRLDSGEPSDAVKAAGELAVLEAKHRDFAAKIEEAKARHTENWSLIHTELAEDYDAIMNNLENWITRH
jgi:hypothetical protein